MKVLFAVSSESISEAIIKRYQKEYKEILSYKNVYYFNAILKEIQKDKTYDRIVISEDLEPFSNNNYDTIDKFIFEKLDSISDEAHDSQGKETSIILICTDRRIKGNSILVKLFGIGVYNALLGKDRNMDEVCKLINRPRTKKEAKTYYQIDTDDVNYKAESENEVSEVEIQNILAHFKKLGKNTARYSDSFNNIAIQYTDEQLKIIVNCLPINVKAVLEANCERYQQLMSVSGGIQSVKGVASTSIEGTIKNEISERKIGQAGKITKPIVIPSAVRNAKHSGSPVVKKAPTAVPENIEPQAAPPQRPVVRATKAPEGTIANQTVQGVRTVNKAVETRNNPVKVAPTAKTVNPVARQVASNPKTISTQNGVVRRQPVANTAQVEEKTPVKEEVVELEEDLLPGFDSFDEIQDTKINNNNVENTTMDFDSEELLPGFEEEMPIEETIVEENKSQEIELDGLEIEETTRRGRGRPRKTLVSGAEIKPKGKRGRPRKIVEESEELSDVILPGMEEDFVEDEMTLPGMEEDFIEDNTELPGMEEDFIEDDTELPGMEEDFIEDDAELPGMEEDFIEDEIVDELPVVAEEDLDEEFLDEEYTEEVSVPGLDDLDDVEDNLEQNLTGFEDEETLPEMAFDDNEGDDLLQGFSQTEDLEEETLLPGMGFEDEYTSNDTISHSNSNIHSNYESNSLESIKPRVDYSMSSLNSLITKDKKIVTFIGTSKNGTSFLVNNLAALFSSIGINTAILDMTQNKNSYYIYTKNEEELRNIAFNSIEKLQNGYAEGIRVDKNLTVYTSLPNDGKDYSNAEPILSTLVQNHSLILIDCDYDTDISYFASCQEMYLVQSMDILTIQPLTAFLRELKTKGVLEPEKIRVVINKELKVRSLSIKAIVGGLSYYNDPAMSFMTELFNKDIVKTCTIPFEDNAYSKYLEGIVNCSISLNGYSKAFLSKLKILGDMVYPLTSKQSYNRTSVDYNKNAFSSSMNDTLNKMRKKY